MKWDHLCSESMPILNFKHSACVLELHTYVLKQQIIGRNILCFNNSTLLLFICVDLVRDPVQNLSAAVNQYNPSVTLNWEPPGNVRDAEELAEYHIRFKPFGDKDYVETTVTGSTTKTVLTRDSGLVPLKNYHFQVRAQSGCCKGEWKEVTSFYGKHCTCFTV